jgi:hypothetical protein
MRPLFALIAVLCLAGVIAITARLSKHLPVGLAVLATCGIVVVALFIVAGVFVVVKADERWCERHRD